MEKEQFQMRMSAFENITIRKPLLFIYKDGEDDYSSNGSYDGPDLIILIFVSLFGLSFILALLLSVLING